MIEIVRGRPGELAEIADFISLAFSMGDGVERSLPKIYNFSGSEQTHWLIREDGRIRACLNALPLDLYVGGETLHTVGIGAVCVHRADRKRGYMQTLMKHALDEARASGADFSMLGGNRQRYAYFGFQPCGMQFNADLSADNLLHGLRDADASSIELCPLSPDDPVRIGEALRLHDAQTVHAQRTPENFYAVCCSWKAQPWVILDKGRMIGYLVVSKDIITELVLEDYSRMNAVVRAAAERLTGGTVRFLDGVLEPGRLAFYTSVCGGVSLTDNKRYLFYRYENTIRAFLQYKATLRSLPEGTLCLGIEGCGTLRITLEKGCVQCEQTQQPAELTVSAERAPAWLFSPSRSVYGFGTASHPLADAWFPLPLYFSRPDVL